MNPEITVEEHSSPSGTYRLFTVDFFGTEISVTLTSAPSAVRKWVSKTCFLRNQRGQANGRFVVGVAVQWNPYNGNDSPADTLQLCVGTRCLIFQISQAHTVPLLLRRFLLDGGNTFVGIWNSQDEKKLETEHQLQIHRLLDLRNYAVDEYGNRLWGKSMGAIVEEYLGFPDVDLDKNISLSAWDEDLEDEQVLQACVKAYVAFEIGKNMGAWQF